MMRVSYSDDLRVAYFNGYKFRKDLKTGYYLSTRKTDTGRAERLHRYVWRFYNGDIPDGYNVHHVDEDKANNEIENLLLLPKGEHSSLHGNERWKREPDKMIENLIENAIPASKAWHASEEGRKWHSSHSRQIIDNLKPQTYICEYCHKEYKAFPTGRHRFCSGACSSASRRKSGVDNEKRVCAVCGKEFYVSKYKKTETCSRRCGNVLRWNTRHNAMRETTGLQYGS